MKDEGMNKAIHPSSLIPHPRILHPSSLIPHPFILHPSSFILHPSSFTIIVMRVDFDRREIVCSVGDLVYESTYRRIGVERGDGFRRMWIGQDVHGRRAEERAGEDPHYKPEVHVSYRTTLRGWNITIAGRID